MRCTASWVEATAAKAAAGWGSAAEAAAAVKAATAAAAAAAGQEVVLRGSEDEVSTMCFSIMSFGSMACSFQVV